MKVEYRIAEEDYVNAARLHSWRQFFRRPSNAQITAGFILLLVIGYGLLTFPKGTAAFLLSIAVCSVIAAIVLSIAIPIRARRHYRQYKGIQEPGAVEQTEAGIAFSGPNGEGVLRWSNIHQWRQNKRLVLIYGMPVLYYILPKSIERDGFDMQRLIQLLAERVGPER